jgi:hypothetical protein
MIGNDDPDPMYADRLIEAFLASEAMNESQRYLERGRELAAVDAGILRERWTAAFKQFLKSRTASDCRALDDVSAELGLRNLDRPFETVKEEMAMVQAQIRQDGQTNFGIQVLPKIEAFFKEFDRDPN